MGKSVSHKSSGVTTDCGALSRRGRELYRLVGEIAAQLMTTDPDTMHIMISDLTKRLSAVTDGQRAFVTLLDSENQSLRVIDGWPDRESASVRTLSFVGDVRAADRLLERMADESFLQIDADDDSNGSRLIGAHSRKPGGSASMLLVKLSSDDTLIGFLGLERCEHARAWSRDEIAALVTLGKVVGGALAHARHRELPGGDRSEVMKAGPDTNSWSDARRTLLENAAEVFVCYDRDRRIRWANKAAGESVGEDSARLVGRQCYHVWSTQGGECEDCPVSRALASGRTCETDREMPDGRIWHLRATPVKDKLGHVTGVAEFGFEITDHKHAMLALRESETRFRQLTEAIPVLVFVVDDSGEIEMYNAAAESYLGLSQITGKPLFLETHLHQGDQVRADAAWSEALVAGRRLRLEVRIRRAEDSTFRWHEVQAVPVSDADGRVNRWFGTAVDIHERQQAEEALLETNRLLSEEKQLLQDKNIALREVMNQVREQDRNVKEVLQANVDRLLQPLLRKIESHCDTLGRTYLDLLRNSLAEIVSPFHSRLTSLQATLTPREVEICHMIRSGLNSKEMAATFHVSVNTIFNQRRSIRRKLQISGSDANLTTFLTSLGER